MTGGQPMVEPLAAPALATETTPAATAPHAPRWDTPEQAVEAAAGGPPGPGRGPGPGGGSFSGVLRGVVAVAHDAAGQVAAVFAVFHQHLAVDDGHVDG